MNIRRAIFNIIDIMCKVVLVVIAVMFIIRGVSFAYEIGLQVFDQRPVSAVDNRTVVFTVSGADSVADIAKNLEEKKLIQDARIFRIQERLSVYHDMIGAGTYELSPSMTADEMIAIMAAPMVEAKKNQEAAEAAFNEAAASVGFSGGTEDDADADESDDAAGMRVFEEEGGEEAPEGEAGEEVFPEEAPE